MGYPGTTGTWGQPGTTGTYLGCLGTTGTWVDRGLPGMSWDNRDTWTWDMHGWRGPSTRSQDILGDNADMLEYPTCSSMLEDNVGFQSAS